MVEIGHFKDKGLDEIAFRGINVAQFVSHDNEGSQRHSRVVGKQPNHVFPSEAEAAKYLLENSPEHLVNVRSWNPHSPEGSPLKQKLTSTDEVLAVLNELHQAGLHTITHEYMNAEDGGVSGVVFGDTIELTPDDNPRGVDKPGVARFTRKMGTAVIKTIYKVEPNFIADPNVRQEFTISPRPRGVKQEHTVTWEVREMDSAPASPDTQWPNNLSRMLGDKTFGLIVAEQIGLVVPQTQVINRRVAPFTFGRPTGSGEFWMRTAPNSQEPGLYTTTHGWVDPFKIMQDEDPEGTHIASILSQEGIKAEYSGVCIMGADGQLIVEGKRDYGDDFMVGESGTIQLPCDVIQKVKDNYFYASEQLGGPVRFEWVFDGDRIWTVQLHRGESASYGHTLFPGDETTVYTAFAAHDVNGHSRIEELRELIAHHTPGVGIELMGDVGVTSHLGDMLRIAKVPSFITSGR